MTVEKPKPKQLLRPITTGAGSAMSQSPFLAITCNSLVAREKSQSRNYFRQSIENCSKYCSTCTPTFSKLGNAPLTFSITSFTLHKIKYNTAWSYKLIKTKKGNQRQGQENHNSLAYYYCRLNISLSLVSSIVNWVWGIVCVLSSAVSFSNQRLS